MEQKTKRKKKFLPLKIFLSSNSSAVGRWLNFLRNKHDEIINEKFLRNFAYFN